MLERRDAIIRRRLIAAREERGLTQPELAALLERSKGWYAKIEQGVNGISAADLYNASKIMRFPVGWFFGEGESSIDSSRLTKEQERIVREIVDQFEKANRG